MPPSLPTRHDALFTSMCTCSCVEIKRRRKEGLATAHASHAQVHMQVIYRYLCGNRTGLMYELGRPAMRSRGRAASGGRRGCPSRAARSPQQSSSPCPPTSTWAACRGWATAARTCPATPRCPGWRQGRAGALPAWCAVGVVPERSRPSDFGQDDVLGLRRTAACAWADAAREPWRSEALLSTFSRLLA